MPTIEIDGKTIRLRMFSGGMFGGSQEDLTPLEAEKLARELQDAAKKARGAPKPSKLGDM
jgi:hypothetical protein